MLFLPLSHVFHMLSALVALLTVDLAVVVGLFICCVKLNHLFVVKTRWNRRLVESRLKGCCSCKAPHHWGVSAWFMASSSPHLSWGFTGRPWWPLPHPKHFRFITRAGLQTSLLHNQLHIDLLSIETILPSFWIRVSITSLCFSFMILLYKHGWGKEVINCCRPTNKVLK